MLFFSSHFKGECISNLEQLIHPLTAPSSIVDLRRSKGGRPKLEADGHTSSRDPSEPATGNDRHHKDKWVTWGSIVRVQRVGSGVRSMCLTCGRRKSEPLALCSRLLGNLLRLPHILQLSVQRVV
jgi:hypothetical protein